jgi:hypothetical protein
VLKLERRSTDESDEEDMIMPTATAHRDREPVYGHFCSFPLEHVRDWAARLAAFTALDYALFGVVVLHQPVRPAQVARRLGWAPALVAERLAGLEAAGVITRDSHWWPSTGDDWAPEIAAALALP